MDEEKLLPEGDGIEYENNESEGIVVTPKSVSEIISNEKKFTLITPKKPDMPAPLIPPLVKKIEPIQRQTQGDEIKPIRTYTSDAAEAIKRDRVSVINIAVAESKKKESAPIEYQKEPVNKNLLTFSVILILIAFALIAATYYFWIVGSKKMMENQSVFVPSPMIETTDTKEFVLNTENPIASLKTAIASLSNPVGSTINLTPLTLDNRPMATSSIFFQSLGIKTPDQIKLSLSGEYTFGVYISNPNHLFIILGISSFENAFAGMLSWEKSMREDLINIIELDHQEISPIVETGENWTDMRIENQDARVLVKASSSPILVYSFVGPNRLIIATNKETFSKIILKINATNTIR